MEIVTGKAGVPHVSSADDGRRIAGEVGTGSYVLQTGGKLAPSLVDANTVRIATGDMIVQGRHIGVTAPEDVKVASGSQGKKRMDYICVHYTRDVSGSSPTLVEKVEWKVLQGTPGSSAAAPSVPKGSILDGDADVTVPICSVTFDGLTTGQPKLLIPTLTPLATLGDSVSHTVLYKNAKGTIGNFTLGEEVTGFAYVDIYYKSGVVRMYPAAYSTVILCANSFNPDGSLDVEGASLSFSGKAATFTKAHHKLFYMRNGYAVFDHYTEVHQNLAVVLVLGYK